MNNRISGFHKILLSSYRLLFFIILLSLHTVSYSTEPATNVQPDEVGEPNDGIMKEKPKIEDMGQQIYRIGSIKVDKAKRLIMAPGKMLPYEDGKAIEFLATMKQGYKAYESVLSLDANAFEFNLACILIGLDSSQSVSPEFHFDPQPVKGDSVSIKVSWRNNGKPVEYDAAELLKVGEKKPGKPSRWSYTGSMFIEGGRYLAQMDGVLIGLIHDPASIIEHREGLGLGNWGLLTIDHELAPKGGQEVTLTIQKLD